MTFIENLEAILSKEEIEAFLSSLKEESKHALLLNTLKMDDTTFVKLFPNVKPHPIVPHAYLYDKNEYDFGKSIYHELGAFYLQEPSAMIVSSLIDFDKDLVLDMCAAPGGKTIQAALKNKNGIVISNDLSHMRTGKILSNVERLGLDNVLITNNDFSEIYQQFPNKFDVIILDAPCSGSGMFRKKEEMVNDWSYGKVLKNSEIQKELILYAYHMLKPGGVLSYSTCSYSMEEDEEVIEYLLSNSDAQIKPIEIKNGYINKKKNIGVRLFPHLSEGEGQYICHIKKPGTKIPTVFSCQKKNFNLPFNINREVVKYGNSYFSLPYEINIKHLNVIRYGVKLAEENKGIFTYDLHFERTGLINNLATFELNDKEVKDYLHGLSIDARGHDKGNYLISYNLLPICVAKCDGKTLKNAYPKGLRKKFQ